MKAYPFHLPLALLVLFAGCGGPKTPSEAPPEDMLWIPGGKFRMGADEDGGYLMAQPTDEGPVHAVEVDGFWMDATEVTNAQFRKFVEATGYKTVAETPFKQEDYPQAPPEALVPAGYTFFQTDTPVDLRNANHTNWWKFTPGADWQHPDGPGSDTEGKDDHPVVCITHPDAVAYAKWAGKRLPTEAEWEFAARGGLEQKTYPWGDELRLEDKYMANYWQGGFPNINSGDDGFKVTAPVKSFPPNSYGLYDMSGNVWEIVNDFYRKDYYQNSPLENPKGPETSPGETPPTPTRKAMASSQSE